jgi:hypothetical protein
MPSIRASARVDLRGWQTAQTTPVPASQSRPISTPSETVSRSPYMLSSMPLMASTSDAFTRQFYSVQNLPQQRILPAKKGAGT